MSYHHGADEFVPIELKDGEVDPAEIVTKAVEDIQAKFDERLKAIETKSAGRLDKLEARLNRPGAVETKAEGSIERKAFQSFVRLGEARMQADELKAMALSPDASGGYLAPPELGSELIKLLRQFSPLRQYARTVTIGAGSVKYPKRTGSTTAYWVDETEDRTETDMAFGQVTITAYELAAFTDLSNQLLEDNQYNLEGELLADLAESFGKAEGYAFVKGDGDGKPNGIMNATGITEITTGAASGFSSSNPADVMISMFHTLPSVHAQNASWVMNRKTLGAMRTWKDATGRYLLADPIVAGMPTTLLGRPVVEMLDMDDIAANTHPILFGDLQGYRIVDRIGFATLRDPYTLATKGQTRINARKRVGADITHPDRFVKLKVAV